MIKHRKIIICILLSYALFIVSIFNVKAAGYYGCYSSLNNQWGTDVGFSNGFNICRFDNVNISSGSSGIVEMYLTEGTEMNGKTSTMVFRNSTELLITGIYIVDNSNVVSSCELYSTNNTGGVSSYNIICKNVKGIIGNGTKVVAHYLAPQNGSGSYVFGISNYLTFDNETQAITNIQNSTNTINSNITDSSIDTNNTNSSVSGFSSSTNESMSNTPVSSMISLPITFLTGVNNALSNSCTNVNYIELFGYQLVLPCLNLSERLGSVWTIIDTIFSCMLIFSIGKSLVSTFARLSDMDTNIMYECYANGTKHRGESFDD